MHICKRARPETRTPALRQTGQALNLVSLAADEQAEIILFPLPAQLLPRLIAVHLGDPSLWAEAAHG